MSFYLKRQRKVIGTKITQCRPSSEKNRQERSFHPRTLHKEEMGKERVRCMTQAVFSENETVSWLSSDDV
jgi:hypothetical protein